MKTVDDRMAKPQEQREQGRQPAAPRPEYKRLNTSDCKTRSSADSVITDVTSTHSSVHTDGRSSRTAERIGNSN
ncbi:hypothetical protein PC112_g22094 [Phytophthora cactorum]|nr:hypothetical protein PC112_g22094 [Phytophthora cactorum]